jgi:hypothetical protein
MMWDAYIQRVIFGYRPNGYVSVLSTMQEQVQALMHEYAELSMPEPLDVFLSRILRYRMTRGNACMAIGVIYGLTLRFSAVKQPA